MFNQMSEGTTSSAIRRNRIIIVLTICLMLLVTLVSVYAVETLNFKSTVNIEIKDGVNNVKNYIVNQDTVENVLKELNITLNQSDKLNLNKNEIVEENDSIQITRVTKKVVTETVSTKYKTIHKGSKIWGDTLIQNGKDGTTQKTYTITYENGEQVSKVETSSIVINKPVNKIIQHDKIAEGTTFTGRLTTYGGDCSGCGGRASTGIKLSGVTGVNNSNSPFLTYNGKKYYCIAADRSIPFGTIMEISNHNLNLPDTIEAIVVDRGGAIKGRTIDIFNGSESGSKKYFKSNSTNSAKFKIIKLGNGKATFWK